MTKIPLIFLPLFLAAVQAHADLVITLQTEESRRTPQSIVIKTHGDKYLTDISNAFSTITDLTSGDMVFINHQAKSYRKISGGELAQAFDNSMKPDPSDHVAPAQPVQITDTGKSEKIDGHDAEIYTAENPSGSYTYWVVKDYPDYAEVYSTLKKIQARNTARNKADKLTPDVSKLDGIVIKSQVLSIGGNSITTTLLSAKVQPVEESLFTVPDGYTEIKPVTPPPAATPPTPSPAPAH